MLLSGRAEYATRRGGRTEDPDHGRAEPDVICQAAVDGERDTTRDIVGQRHGRNEVLAADTADLFRKRERRNETRRRRVTHRDVMRVVEVVLVNGGGVRKYRRLGR